MMRVRHLKKGDTVVALSGASKGKTGTVLGVNHAKSLVQIEGLGVVKRHTKPSQSSPKGGIVEKNAWIPACKFQVSSEGGKKLGRAGTELSKDGNKTRIFSGARSKK